MSEGLFVAIAALAAGLVVGLLAGRRGAGSARARVRELEAQAEGLRKECELARAEIAVRNDELARSRTEFETYRGRVNEHFSSSVNLLRALTLQYRLACEQLGEGRVLADEALDVGSGAEPGALPEPGPDVAPDPEPSEQPERTGVSRESQSPRA